MAVEIVPETPAVVVSEPAVQDVRTVEFLDAEFAISDRVGLMPLLRFAHAAKSGLDSADMEGMAAMYDMLRQCIADERVYQFQGRILTKAEFGELPPEAVKQVVTYGGWGEFEEHVTIARADDEQLLGLVQKVMTLLSERPTSRPSASSDGPQQTTPTSEESSSSLKVVRRLKSRGRPDLGMAVLRNQVG